DRCGTLGQNVWLASDDPFRIGNPGDLVLVEGSTYRGPVFEVSPIIVPGQHQFKTAVLDIPSVYKWWSGTCGPLDRGHDQPVLGGLDVPVGGKGQSGIKKAGIQSYVQLFRGFPFHIWVGHPCRNRRGPGNGLGIPKIIAWVTVGDIGAVDEIVNVLVSVLAPASP